MAGIGEETGKIISEFSLDKDDEESIYDLGGDGVSIYHRHDADTVYVGISIHAMKDDETKAQFIARASEVLSKKAGKPIQATLFTEGWYNG